MSEKKKKSEIAVVLICMLGIALCIYLLNTPTFLNPNDQSQALVLGEINEAYADVRLKNNKQYFWQKTQPNQKLTEGDSVFTGPKSSSEITLLDGKKIRIAENSLIHFTRKNQQLSVDLAFGKLFSTGSTEPLVISDCGKLYTIEPNDATFELSKGKNCGSIDLIVSKGTIKLNKKIVAKKKIQPALEQSVFTIVDGDLQANSPFAPPQPEPAEVSKPATPEAKISTPQFKQNFYELTLTKTSRVDLAWTAIPEAHDYILEQSDKESFDVAQTFHVSETFFSYEPEKDGVHYFRLKAMGGNGLVSDFGELAKATTTYPKIELGQRKIKAEYKARTSKDLGSKKNFPITWTAVPHAAKYVVEVDENANFTKPIPITSRKPASIIDVPKTGIYHYRVSAFNQQGRKISSSESPGEIIYTKLFDMVTPVIEPALKSLSFYFQKQFGQFIWLRWIKTSGPSDFKYRVQLAASANFEKIFYDQFTVENKILLNKNLSQGEYFWRVRTENSEQTSDWSELGSFKIQTQPSKGSSTK